MRSHFATRRAMPSTVARLRDQARAEVGLAQDREPLLERQRRDRLIARPVDERVLRHLEAEQDAGRSRQHLAEHRQPRGIGLGDPAGKSAPLLGLRVALQQRDRHRPAATPPPGGATGRTRPRRSSKSETTCIQPLPMSRSAPAIAASSASRPRKRRDRAAVQRLVVQRARGREAQSARPRCPSAASRPSPRGPARWRVRDRRRARP